MSQITRGPDFAWAFSDRDVPVDGVYGSVSSPKRHHMGYQGLYDAIQDSNCRYENANRGRYCGYCNQFVFVLPFLLQLYFLRIRWNSINTVAARVAFLSSALMCMICVIQWIRGFFGVRGDADTSRRNTCFVSTEYLMMGVKASTSAYSDKSSFSSSSFLSSHVPDNSQNNAVQSAIDQVMTLAVLQHSICDSIVKHRGKQIKPRMDAFLNYFKLIVLASDGHKSDDALSFRYGTIVPEDLGKISRYSRLDRDTTLYSIQGISKLNSKVLSTTLGMLKQRFPFVISFNGGSGDRLCEDDDVDMLWASKWPVTSVSTHRGTFIDSRNATTVAVLLKMMGIQIQMEDSLVWVYSISCSCMCRLSYQGRDEYIKTIAGYIEEDQSFSPASTILVCFYTAHSGCLPIENYEPQWYQSSEYEINPEYNRDDPSWNTPQWNQSRIGKSTDKPSAIFQAFYRSKYCHPEYPCVNWQRSAVGVIPEPLHTKSAISGPYACMYCTYKTDRSFLSLSSSFSFIPAGEDEEQVQEENKTPQQRITNGMPITTTTKETVLRPRYLQPPMHSTQRPKAGVCNCGRK